MMMIKMNDVYDTNYIFTTINVFELDLEVFIFYKQMEVGLIGDNGTTVLQSVGEDSRHVVGNVTIQVLLRWGNTVWVRVKK